MQTTAEFAPRWRKASGTQDFLYLGRIIDNLEGDLAACKGSTVDDPGHRIRHYVDQYATWELYDQTYGFRPDYRIYRFATRQPYFRKRHIVVPPGATKASSHWAPAIEEANHALKSERDLRIVWGVFTSLPDLIARTIETPTEAALKAASNIVENAQQRLASLGVLQVCSASCGLTAALFEVAAHRLRVRLNPEMEYYRFRKWLEEIDLDSSFIDPHAGRGQRLKTGKLSVEQGKQGPRLRPADASDNQENLILLHQYVSQAITKQVQTMEGLDDELLSRAFDAAKAAWYHARTRRITEEKHQRDVGGYDTDSSQNYRRRLFKSEAERLIEVAGAAQNLGLHLEESKLLHLFYALIPRDVKEDDDAFGHLKALGESHWQPYRRVREAGLLVGAFRDDDASGRVQETAHLVEMLEHARGLGGLLASVPDKPIGLFERRLKADMMTAEDWRVIQANWPKPAGWRHRTYLRNLLRIFADGEDQRLSEQEFGALFAIARRYGFIRSAAKLIAKNTPHLDQILDFANDLKRCAQSTPFGWNKEKLEEWRQLLCKLLCAGAPGSQPIEQISNQQRLLIHEVLMGLGSTHLRGLPRGLATKLYESWQGSIEVDDLHDLYDKQLNFEVRGPATIDHSRLQGFAQNVSDVTGEKSAYVSVCLLDDGVSVLAVGQTASGHGLFLSLPELEEDIATVREHAALWFIDPTEPFEQQVGWNESLLTLAEEIIEVAERVQGAVRSIVLAVPSTLAALPLQHLFMSALAGRSEEREIIISVVPNLGTLPLGWRNSGAPSASVWLSSEQDEYIPQVVEAVTAHGLTGTKYRLPISVVVGHGSLPSDTGLENLPIVSQGPGAADLDDVGRWKEVIQTGGVALIAACSTGSMDAAQLGGFGALPLFALGLGCRLLIAPVKEVDPETAIALIDRLFGSEANQEASIGDLYLAAIQDDPSVALFNLYGVSLTKHKARTPGSALDDTVSAANANPESTNPLEEPWPSKVA